MRINQNISAMNAYRQLTMNQVGIGKSLEKLSSGLRINRAADDAAGLAISEKMRAQVRGTAQAIRNAQDGISLIQTAEGALTESHAILQRMRELAVQAANGTYDDTADADLAKIQAEVDQLIEELDRIADETKFNGKVLFDSATTITLQIGADEGVTMDIAMADMDATTLLGGATFDITDANAISTIDDAIETVSSFRADLGAYQNRLEHTINNLGVARENLAAAEARIRDVDMAEEMMNFTKFNILNQAATAMLAQANALPQSVLQLLG